MKRFSAKCILASLAIMMAFTSATAQIDFQQSFGVMCNEDDDFMFAEGGNWKITFATTDSLGNEYNKPVQMMVNGALYPDTAGYYISEIDSLLFKLPEKEYAAGVFEIGEELFQYIVDSDSATTISFRIDCLTKTKIPKVGQKVICNIYRDKLPYGFMGLVKSMYADYNNGVIIMRCGTVAIEDIYDVFYSGGVAGAVGTDEVPDSLIERKVVQSRIPTRSMYDVNDTLVNWKKGYKLDYKLAITDKGEFKIIKDGKAEDETPVVLGVEGNAFLYAECSVMIDVEEKIKKIKCEVGAVVDGKLYFEVSGEVKPKEGDKKEFDFLTIPIPIAVLPGLSINVDFGFTWDYSLAAKIGAEGSFKISRHAGFEIDGNKRDVIWDDGNDNFADNPLNFENDYSAEASFAGELFLAFHAKVGIGVAGEGLEFQLKFGTGPKFEGKIAYKYGQRDFEIRDEHKWIEQRKEMYSNLNETTHLTVEWGFLFDMQFSALNDGWTFSVGEWMEKVGLDNKVFFEIYRLNGGPDVTEIENKKLYNGRYSGVLRNTAPTMFTYDASIMFLDISAGGTGPNGLIEYHATDLGTFRTLKSDYVDFDIDISGKPILKGRQIGVYPLVYNKLFTGYMVVDKCDEFYIPYDIKFTRYDKDYERAEFEAEFDKDALDNSYITEGGFIFLDPETNAVIKPVVVFDKPHPGSNVMKMTVERGMFPRDEFNVQAYIYDKANDKFMYSNIWPGGFFEYYAPTTEDATEITATGATLNASLHSSIYEAEDMNHVDNRFSVGFAYYPDAKSAMDYLNNVRKVGYEWNLDGKLKPDTEYMFNAVVQDHETGKTYKGLTVKFRTKPVFSDTEAKASYTKVLLFAKVDKGFMGTSNKNNYKFLVSDKRELIDLGDVINISPEDIGRDSDEDDYEIILEVDNKWERDKEHYFKIVYDDGKGNRHESAVQPFSVPPPIDNLTAKPGSESAELEADVQGEYALGKVKTTIQFAATNKDFDEIAEEIDITDKAGWASKEMDVYLLNYTLENLDPATTYYYRYRLDLELDDGSVDYATPIHMFKTKKLDLMATTMSASVTKNRVSMAGSVTKPLKERLDASVQDEKDKQYMLYFEVSKSKDMSASALCYVPLTEEREYSAELRNLAWNTKYYYRFVAMTADKKQTYRGSIKSFSIGEEPLENFDLETFDALLDDEWTILRGKVNSQVLDAIESGEYEDLYIGFEYALSVADLNEGNENVYRDGTVTVNMNTGYYSQVLNLMPDTKYYYRAFVYAGGKFAYGNIVEFTTPYYDAGLIVPDNVRRYRGIKAVMSNDGSADNIIFLERGKKIIPTEAELKLLNE